MIVEVKVPAVGESILEGVVGSWLVADGTAVTKHQPLFELETDKTNSEISAPEAGVLRRLAKEGDTVKVGAVVATLDTDGKATATPLPPARVVDVPPPPPAPKAMIPPPPVPASQEVANYKPVTTDPRGERRERMSRLRKTIAERMLKAQSEAAILTTFNEADVSGIVALRAKYKDRFKEKHAVGLGFMSFFVRACAEAIREVPKINAFIEGDEIVFHDYCDFGIAVGGDKGLIVPVVRSVEKMSFAKIEATISELAARARLGKIELHELQGGTFTISNVGIYGPMLGTPIINPPQSAILGMYGMKDRVVVGEDRQPVVRPIMGLALSYDHRLLDGKDAALFLGRVKELVENPERLLLGV